MTDALRYERSFWSKGIDFIAGVDEVGRGALAGPMVAGAVILKTEDLKNSTNNDVYSQIKDSKLLSPKSRAELSEFIIKNCVCYSVFQVPAYEIDTDGISACTQKAFLGAVKWLHVNPEHILTDAFPIKEFPQTVQTNIVSGDRLSITISAASIVAKVYRDNLMCELGNRPDCTMYGFEKHKGYGTKLHMENIVRYGLSNLHRKTFIHLT
jgi:ribonuclease HII